MRVFDHSETDLALWRHYLDFHLRMSAGLWSPGLVMRPYGALQLGVDGDWGDLLWRAHESRWTIEDIITDIEHLSSLNLNKPGFYFNAGFSADLAHALQEQLPAYGYQKRYGIRWLTRDIQSAAAVDIPDSYILTDAQKPDDSIRVHHEAFPDEAMDHVYQRHIPVPKGAVDTRFLVLYDRTSHEPIAMGGMTWEGDVAYMFGLGVRTEYRRRGIAKLMVDWRLHTLAQSGVRYVITAVMDGNESSFALQQQKGYRYFADTECWLKNPEKT